MGWLKNKNNFNGLEEFKKALILNPDGVLAELAYELKQQDFSTCWIVLKEVLPLLEKTKKRDIVRSLVAKSVPHLIALVDQRQERELAIECLSYLPSREVVEFLTTLLNHKDDNVQLMASGALQNHTPRLVVPLLVDGMVTDNVATARAGQVLLAMGFFAQEILLEAYPKAEPRVQARFLELMILGDNPKCCLLVKEALNSPHPSLKKTSLEAVEFFSLAELWTEVVMCLAEEDWVIKAKALEVLAKLKVVEALEYVEILLQDPDPWVSQCAAECIKALELSRIEEYSNESSRGITC